MNYKAYIIKTLTNMHVGTGDSNFGVVDKLVQRDPVSNYPTIYSSSLKGALREHCKDYDKNKEFINYIFGGENKDKKSLPGSYCFFQANLLALPVRSNKKPFFMATCPAVLDEFIQICKNFEIDEEQFNDLVNLSNISPNKNEVLIHEDLHAKIEEWDSLQDERIPETANILRNNIALFHNDAFKELTKHLPVVARNNLENGKSTNLWYEEIVPRESIFYFIVGEGDDHQTEFETKIQNGIVQIGGNASIGYGFTKITEIGG